MLIEFTVARKSDKVTALMKLAVCWRSMLYQRVQRHRVLGGTTINQGSPHKLPGRNNI